MTNIKTPSDLVNRLRETASKGVSVWGDLQMEAAREIEILTAEREAYVSTMDRLQSAQPVAQSLPVEQMASNVAVEYQLRAMSICQEAKKVSVSMVQRKLGISYNAAQEVCQSLVDSGFVPGLPISPSLAHGIAAANKKGTV